MKQPKSDWLEKVRKDYRYIPDSGEIIHVLSGVPLRGFIVRTGPTERLIFTIDRKQVIAARFAWMLHTDDPLPNRVRLKNGNVRDLRWSNIIDGAKEVSRFTSFRGEPVKGYTKTRHGTYAVSVNIGTFTTEKEAREAYLNAIEKLKAN